MQGQQFPDPSQGPVIDYAAPLVTQSPPNRAATIALCLAAASWMQVIPQVFPRRKTWEPPLAEVILACVSLALAAAAILLSEVGRSRAKHLGTSGRRRAILALVLVLPPAWLASDTLINASTADTRRGAFEQQLCADHLRQIGGACRNYAQVRAGRFPGDLSELFTADELRPEHFICLAGLRNCGHSVARGPTINQTAALLAFPRHNSYVYVGAGLTTSSPASSVVAYDRPTNHGSEGINVLYADGAVTWLPGKDVPAFLATVPPPSAPATTQASHATRN